MIVSVYYPALCVPLWYLFLLKYFCKHRAGVSSLFHERMLEYLELYRVSLTFCSSLCLPCLFMRQWHWNHTSFHVSPILYFFSPCTTLFPHTLCAYAPIWICVHPLAHVCTPMCTHSQVIFNVAELSESGNNVTLHVEASQGMVLKNMSALAMLTPLWIYSISFSMNHGAEILNIILILIFFPSRLCHSSWLWFQK